MSIQDSIPESETWWDDPDFQNKLVALLVQDQATLLSCASLLSPDDFKPSKGIPDGRPRWLLAERALEHFEKFHEPLGNQVRADVLEYAHQLNLGASQVTELRDYLKRLTAIKTTAPDALVQKVIRFKSNTLKKNAINDLSDLLSSGQLTDEKWNEVTHRISEINKSGLETVDYLDTLEDRIERRKIDRLRLRTPATFIDPLDAVCPRTIGPKQLGLILAPYKRGKSTMLLWLSVSLLFQGYNVLYVTLEDTRDIVEDRLDSIITSVPIKMLHDKPKTLRQRLQRYKNMMGAKLKIYDGTGDRVTIAMLERIVQRFRDEGFIIHALITDYDEELVPARRHKEKRDDSDEIYRDYRSLCARYNMIGWLAAQTQRNTRHLKILSGDRAAEDIGKAKKVTCCISLGKGDWSDESIYVWVAAHKNARMEVGAEIIPDLERGLIYDRDATTRAYKANVSNNP